MRVIHASGKLNNQSRGSFVYVMTMLNGMILLY